MRQRELLQIFQHSGALLKGHFLLTSGLHSGQYLQCARILENPRIAEKLCRALAANFKANTINTVIAPALGGIIIAYELARALNARALFAERKGGKMQLRRGFTLSAEDKVLVAEDVITTGGSVKEIIELAKASGAGVVATCALADRSQGKIDFGAPFITLIKMDIPTFQKKNCPLCKMGLDIVKPGSRK